MEEGFSQLVIENWSTLLPQPVQDDMYSLAHNIKRLKEKVKVWTKTRTLAMKRESTEIEFEIHSLLSSCPSGILSLKDMNSLHVLRSRKDKVLAHELLTWQLKGRKKWAELGNANTKYFHSLALARINFNSIWALKNEEDVWVENDDKLKELGVKHFLEIFKDDDKSNIVD